MIKNNIRIRISIVIFATQLAGGLFLKMLKYFEVMLNVFDFLRLWGRKRRILIGLCKEAFLNCPTIFLDSHNEMKLVSACLSCF